MTGWLIDSFPPPAFSVLSVSVERWCRLRGNLLFYFKSRDHLSDPAGLIVVEECSVAPEDDGGDALGSTFGIVLDFGGGLRQHLATYTEQERDSWLCALRRASHRTMRQHLQALRERLRARLGSNPALLAALGGASGPGGIAASDTVEEALEATGAGAHLRKPSSVIGRGGATRRCC